MSSKLLVTGSLGFLGSRFTKRFGSRYEILGFDSRRGQDILDYDLLLNEVAGCDCVLHLAALSTPDPRYGIEEYFRQNVLGTLNVAKAAAATGVRRIVFASSMAVYGLERGIPIFLPITEQHPIISQHLSSEQFECVPSQYAYHVSKVMAEQALAWYGYTRKLEVMTLRLGPIDHVFRGTSLSVVNATEAIRLALECEDTVWHECLTVTDALAHIDLTRAATLLGYRPEPASYRPEQVVCELEPPLLSVDPAKRRRESTTIGSTG